MQELTVRFTPDDGTEPRAITLRIGAAVRGDTSWSALVEVLGFDEPFSRPFVGEDWAQAIELAARILPVILENRVAEAGGGTLEPSFYEREANGPDLSKLPPEVRAIFVDEHGGGPSEPPASSSPAVPSS